MTIIHTPIRINHANAAHAFYVASMRSPHQALFRRLTSPSPRPNLDRSAPSTTFAALKSQIPNWPQRSPTFGFTPGLAALRNALN